MGVFSAHRIAKFGSCSSKVLLFKSWMSCWETSIADWSRTQTSRRWRGWLITDSLHQEKAIANKQKEFYAHQSLHNLSYRVWPLGVFPFFVIAYDTLHCSEKMFLSLKIDFLYYFIWYLSLFVYLLKWFWGLNHWKSDDVCLFCLRCILHIGCTRMVRILHAFQKESTNWQKL